MALLPDDAANYNIQTALEVAGNILSYITIGGAIAALIMFLWGGMLYISAAFGGDESRANQGKTTIMWAIVGVVVILLARIILMQFFSLIGPGQDIGDPTSTENLQEQLNRQNEAVE